MPRTRYSKHFSYLNILGFQVSNLKKYQAYMTYLNCAHTGTRSTFPGIIIMSLGDFNCQIKELPYCPSAIDQLDYYNNRTSLMFIL